MTDAATDGICCAQCGEAIQVMNPPRDGRYWRHVRGVLERFEAMQDVSHYAVPPTPLLGKNPFREHAVANAKTLIVECVLQINTRRGVELTHEQVRDMAADVEEIAEYLADHGALIL
jgi:hypothetical protein